MLLQLLILYCTLLLLTTVFGLINYKKMGPSTKIIFWYIGATFLVETAATLAGYFLKYNLIIYHIYSYLQLFLISLYFHSVSEKFKRNKILLWSGLIGITLGLMDALFVDKPKDNINGHFLVIESFLIIGMSLFSFYELLASDEIDITHNPRFWFSALFLVFWSFTFFYWLIGLTIRNLSPEHASWMHITLWAINFLTYSGDRKSVV